jgi:hypothetical protein
MKKNIDSLERERYYNQNIDFDDKTSLGVKIISIIIGIIFLIGLGTIIWFIIQLIKSFTK